MKLASLPIGTAVCLGKVDQVERGHGGFKAFYLGKGKYTLAYQPCGRYIIQDSSYARVQAVIAIDPESLHSFLRQQNKHFWRIDKTEFEWVPWLVGPSMLRMTWEEYDLKGAGWREEQAMKEVRIKEKKRLKEEALTALEPYLPPVRFRYYGEQLEMDPEEVASWLVQKRKTKAAKALQDYLNYHVEVCN